MESIKSKVAKTIVAAFSGEEQGRLLKDLRKLSEDELSILEFTSDAAAIATFVRETGDLDCTTDECHQALEYLQPNSVTSTNMHLSIWHA